MKKLFLILIFSLITHLGYSQAFTQTFVDRCTGDVQVVTANFVQGSAVVSFYNRIRLFTYQEYLNGELQKWLVETYAWWNALSPCSQAQAQATQAQQTAQQTAQSTTTTTNTSSTSSSSSSNTTSTSSNSSSDGDKSTSSSSSSSETKTEETKTEETKTEETKTEENSEESKSEEESTEDSEEKEEESTEDSEETEEESSDEEEDDKMLPIQLKADMLTMQSLTLDYNAVINIGASQSSIYGDVSYGANLMVWDNLQQVSLSINTTKVTMGNATDVSWVDSYGVTYMRNFNTNVITGVATRMKPMGKWGTVGLSVNYSYMFGKDSFNEKVPSILSLGYSFLYTNSFPISKRITYSPALIGAQNPLSYTTRTSSIDSFAATSRDFIGILSNSFTVQLTRRFSFNMGWTLIYSSNQFVPLMNSFMIGAKLPF